MNSLPTPDLSGLRQAFPYPRSEPGATTVLGRKIKDWIARHGPLPFQNFMARCLYDAENGYYSRPHQPTISKDGDFMTSISVGPCFGRLLAQRIRRFLMANGSPQDFAVIEIGAHDGALADDIISELGQDIRYTIIEPLPERRNFLADKFGDRITILESPEKVAPFGVLIANEVLDALPVPILLFSKGGWHEVAVTSDNGLEWSTLESLSSPHVEFTKKLGSDFPEGYVTEGPPDLTSFLTPLDFLFDKGLFTFIDYGLDAENLYSTARTVGTFRCYRQHRSNSHPLDFPGEQDLTADVNFTAVEDASRDLGLFPCPTMNQSRFLTHCAKEWLVSDNPPDASELRQFQTLIHPSQFGSRFYFLELLKGPVDRAFP